MLTFYSCDNDNENENSIDVTTSEVTSIKSTEAILGVNIADKGKVMSRFGLCWSTSALPTLSDSTYSRESLNFKYQFSSIRVQDLTPKTTYYVRGFAIRNDETVYGNEVRFTTLD